MPHCFTPIRGRRIRVTKVNALGVPVYGPAAYVTTGGFVSVQFTPEIEEGEETTVKTAGGDICQISGTRVMVVDEDGGFREIPIEQVEVGQRVLSWATTGRGGCLREAGSAVTRVGRRDYDGDIVTVSVPSGQSSSYTFNHICRATVGDAFDVKSAVYVMRRRGDYRIGWTSRGDGSQNALTDTIAAARDQGADAVWVLSTHTSDRDAALNAALAQHEFTMPSQAFVDDSEFPVHEFWAKVGSNELDASRCLAAYGRDVAFPLWDDADAADTPIQGWIREPLAVRACNLMTGMLVCEVETTPLAEQPVGIWRTATVERQPYAGTVYSLEVAGDHSYVADRIVTMNCVSEKSCDSLKWITVQIEFCQVDPCLFTLINETWTELRDCMGEVVGWAESHSFSCDTGFSLELWTDVTGYTPTTPGAAGAWGYMLLSMLVGGSIGEQTVENGAVSFTITARTKRGSTGWGVGPYDVMCNDPVTGECGPLLTPVGADEPRRIFLTTCPPPAAMCGCQPLSAPDGPPMTVAEDDTDTTRMSVEAQIPLGTVGAYKVNWGDGAPTQDIIPGTPLNHMYTTPGTYSITSWDSTNAQKVTVATVTVPFEAPLMPRITASEAAGDADKMSVSLLVNNHGNGPVTVKWGQTPALADSTNPGDNTTATVQKYTENGTWTVTVTDANDPTLTSTQQVVVPYPPAPALNLTVVDNAPGDPSPRRTALATWDNQGEGPVKLFWGDEPVSPPPAGIDKPESGTDTHTYLAASDGTVTVRVVDANTPTREATQVITLPDFPPTLLAMDADDQPSADGPTSAGETSAADEPGDDDSASKSTSKRSK